MAYLGGNTNRAAGGLNAAESQPQAKAGIKDSKRIPLQRHNEGRQVLEQPLIWSTLLPITLPSLLTSSTAWVVT